MSTLIELNDSRFCFPLSITSHNTMTFCKIYKRGERETSAAGRPIKLLKDRSTETGDWSVKKGQPFSVGSS